MRRIIALPLALATAAVVVAGGVALVASATPRESSERVSDVAPITVDRVETVPTPSPTPSPSDSSPAPAPTVEPVAPEAPHDVDDDHGGDSGNSGRGGRGGSDDDGGDDD
jgi:hypothetical protein